MNDSSKLFRVNGRDFLTALANAVFGAVVIVLYGVVTMAGFDLFSANWAEIGKSAINAVFIVFVSSLGMAFGIDKNGKILGGI